MRSSKSGLVLIVLSMILILGAACGPAFPMEANSISQPTANLGEAPQPQPASPVAAEPVPGNGSVVAEITHTVQSGECLAQIARNYGVPLNEIIAANNLSDPNLVYQGQKINIPAGGLPDSLAPTPSPTQPPEGAKKSSQPQRSSIEKEESPQDNRFDRCFDRHDLCQVSGYLGAFWAIDHGECWCTDDEGLVAKEGLADKPRPGTTTTSPDPFCGGNVCDLECWGPCNQKDYEYGGYKTEKNPPTCKCWIVAEGLSDTATYSKKEEGKER